LNIPTYPKLCQQGNADSFSPFWFKPIEKMAKAIKKMNKLQFNRQPKRGIV
jgi:hypothetical protein